MQKNSRNTSLLRVPQVLERFPVSKSKWWAGVKEGIYPQPIRLGSRCTMWRSDDIDQLIDRISRDSQWVFLDLNYGVLKWRFYWGLGREVQVTSKTVIYRFSLQSHNKIMMAKYHIKLKDLFWSYFPAYVIYFTEGIIIAVFTIFLRERNHRFNTKVWRYTDWLIEGWNAIGSQTWGIWYG